MSFSLTISPYRATFAVRRGLCLIVLSIFLSTAIFVASAVPPCLIATINVFTKSGVLKGKSYYEIMWLYILKTPRDEKNGVQELRRYDERGVLLLDEHLQNVLK